MPADTRLAVLVSGSGTNLQALLDTAAADDDFGGRVVVVGSDQTGARGLERARRARVPTVVEELHQGRDRERWEAALTEGLAAHEPDAVVLAGFMRVLSPRFLARWPGRVVNVHPSLLPAFRGARAVEDALDYGVQVTGVTVHLVDEQVDHGPVIAQRPVAVRPGDTVDSLHERIQAVEHELLPACVRLLCHGRLEVEGRHVRVRGDERPPPAIPDPSGGPDGR